MSHTPAYRHPPARCPSIGCGVRCVAWRVPPADLLPQHTHGDQHVEPPDVYLFAQQNPDLASSGPQLQLIDIAIVY